MMVLTGCFYLQNETLVNGVRDVSNGNISKFVGNPHIYQAPKNNCFIAASASGAHKCSMYKYN